MFVSDGVGGLGFQLAMYRLMDGWEEARRIHDDGVNSSNLAVVTMKYQRALGPI